ncbi:MAG: hypothetical protein IJ708_11380 [Clostridia bacterium]|nr:hypothetical protein [Clostridia bacterium]MBR2287943.1 hypothetical protein [Clostridia bacterium]
MTELDKLPQIADRALGGLEAGPELRYRIQMQALKQRKRQKISLYATKGAALACCAALLFALLAFPKDQAPMNMVSAPVITSMPLGQDVPDTASDDSLLLKGEISATRRAEGTSGIWEEGQGSFPLVSIKGATYRLLTVPSSVDRALRGDSLGSIEEFTTEPSLSDSGILSSNTVPAGTDVYAVSGFKGTFVCAEVNGVDRLFQRVSFNGRATTGKEGLQDTLQASGHVKSLSLTGVGTVTDTAVCEDLMKTLFDSAVFDSTSTLNTSSTLVIELDNGLSAQMLVREDKLSACGTWSSPEFIEAFTKAAK